MRIIKVENGPFMANAYIIIDGIKAIMIDPGLDYELLKSWIDKYSLILTGIIGTHAHPDHIGIVNDLKKKYDIPFFIHKDEQAILNYYDDMLNFIGLSKLETPIPDSYIENEGELKIGNFQFEILHTPGHTPGSICIKIDKILFTGDTLFKQSIGRADLPGGNEDLLINSLERLKNLDENIIIYPGHGPESNILDEKKNNPFLM